MLDLINGFANGWVAVPVIRTFARHKVFESLAQPTSIEALISRHQGNTGHLHAALRLLVELGWVDVDTSGRYTTAVAARAIELPSEDLDTVAAFAMTPAPLQATSAEVRDWVLRCTARWSGVDPALARLMEGAVLTPLLAELHGQRHAFVSPDNSNGAMTAAWSALHTLFEQRDWGRATTNGFQLSPAGDSLLASAGTLGTVVSYASMFGRMEELLFGDPMAVFAADTQGHEGHVDRTVNVTASGVQHQSHFAELDALIISIFDSPFLEAQPRYVADMGCGDGSLLRRIFQVVQTRTRRGPALSTHPLTLIGIDYNARSLEATEYTLTDLPHLLLHGDIADPHQLIADLATRGITDTERILHVRTFLDHDRPFVPVQDQVAARQREQFDYTGVYVTRDGREIPPAHAVQGLIEHLRRWREAITGFGLAMLEVHCLRPATVRRLQDQTESAHYDAFHAFSGQQLVEASVFLMAAAEAGLFPEADVSRCIPKTADFTRISLHHLKSRPYLVRHPTMTDLPALKQLDIKSQPKPLHTPAIELARRVRNLPQNQMVLELDGCIVAALYTQRIASIDVLRTGRHRDLAHWHQPEGRYVQLIGLYVLPEMQGRGYSDALIELMLTYCMTLEGVDAAVGVTRCANFVQHKATCAVEDYVQRQNAQGQWMDPMLHFHTSHGAVIREVLPGFRPDDEDNDGTGVLIEYVLRGESSVTAETGTSNRPSGPSMMTVDPIEPAVRNTVLQVLGARRASVYNEHVPLMEMGLSSLELLELRRLLSTRLGEALPSTFLFSYGTPEAIKGYFAAKVTTTSSPVPSAPTHTSHVSPLSSMPKISSASPERAIAIVGMACRLPGGADTPEQFWRHLVEGHDLVGSMPTHRLSLRGGDAPPFRWQGGFLTDVDRFDAGFFRISPREAELLDPQQRLLLEVAWEALESAALVPTALRGTRSGVFVGLMGSDYADVIAQHGAEADINAQYATGNACSVAAGRLSYFFDWQGPALSIDTACSSSLVAIHTAYRNLLGGECDLALAAGVNLLLDDKKFVAYEQAGMLSPDGRCKTFDASANGYVRGEGCAAVILKRLADAQRDENPILAVIRGSAVNQDGSSSGLTAPNQRAQQAVIEAALAQAQVAPREICYLEAHGTGTSLGDPIEVMAAAHVLGTGRPPDAPLLIGSAKSAIGHLEAAAGIAGLVKTVLSMQHDVIPAQLHLAHLNPHIPWEQLPVQVVTQPQAWPTGIRRAGISSFGFSGTNAHVIIEAYAAHMRVATEEPGAVVIVLSARNEERLRAQAQQLLTYVDGHEVSLTDLAYTLQVGREALGVRLGFIAESLAEVKTKLRVYAEERAGNDGMYRGQVKTKERGQKSLADDEDMAQTIHVWLAKSKLPELLDGWVRGLTVPWERLYGEMRPKPLQLPTYPFARDRHWVTQGVKLATSLRAESSISNVGAGREPPGSQEFTARRGYREKLKGLSLTQYVMHDLVAHAHALLKLPHEAFESETNLVEFGLDSIGLTEFARRLGTHYGLMLTPSLFFSHPSLGRFAAYLLETHGTDLERFYGTDEEMSSPSLAEMPKRMLPEKPLAGSLSGSTSAREPIAIIGMSGRFPRARTVDELWRILRDGEDVVQEIPPERFDWRSCYGDPRQAPDKTLGKWQGCVPGVDEFDPSFFEISPREAEAIDPRQRLLLQEAWRALEDAGYGSVHLQRHTIGMFVGVEQGDYPLLAGSQGAVTSNHDAILSSRLAYVLNLHGPTMAINTACSSGLVAAHQACLSLWAGECDTMIAAGVNLLLTPATLVLMGQAGMLSPEGKCRAFDRRANGMVPGEAVVAVVLKRLSQAQADGDPIHAVITGSGINYDGKTQGITAPSGAAQTQLLQAIYERFRIDPNELDYIVTHGTGTPLGDPVEINALIDAFKPHTQRRGYCAVTSNKTNLGHTQAASGLVNLVTLVLAMRHATIPASLHCAEESEHIAWKASPFHVNKTATPWPARADRPRLGAVSAFGISGTNAHMVVQSYTAETVETDASCRPLYYLLALSAKTGEALKERIDDLLVTLRARSWNSRALRAMSYTLLTGRQHYSHRCAVVIQGCDDAVYVLQQAQRAPPPTNLFHGHVGREFEAQSALLRHGESLLERMVSPQSDTKAVQEAFHALADMYCQGYALPWERLYGAAPPTRISLPTYPFTRGRYWPAPKKEKSRVISAQDDEHTLGCSGSCKIALYDRPDLVAALQRVREPIDIAKDDASGRMVCFAETDCNSKHVPAKLPSGISIVATLPALYPEWLGDPEFLTQHRLRFPYIAGEMSNGIATAAMVIAMARAGMLGFFGSAGMSVNNIEAAINEIEHALGREDAAGSSVTESSGDDLPSWGINLIHTPNEPALEQAVVELCLRRKVRRLSASAFMALTRHVVRYACSGLHLRAGVIQRRNYIFAKISRVEVARQFMSPAPASVLQSLVEQGHLTREEADLAARVPVAEDITAEADSGGHTDNRPLSVLLPTILALRDGLCATYGYERAVRVGAAGGIGSPSGVAAAFMHGAAYVLTGSINQVAVESGTSVQVKEMLSQASMTDIMMAPAADMFELGVKVQVLKRGTMYGARATKLYQLYIAHDSLEAIPPEVRSHVEKDIFRAPLSEIWQRTQEYWKQRDFREIERAHVDPKHKMALVFRWYLGLCSRWAQAADPGRTLDYLIWCGPAVGVFNDWAKGSLLESAANRSVVQMALNLLEGAAVITRGQLLRSGGVRVPAEAFIFRPKLLSVH